MRLKRLVLPGKFVDAYVYFDFAWLFSKDGVVRAFDLARYCEKRLNGEGHAAVALFSNNQLLPEYQRGSEASALAQLLSSDKPIEVAAADVDAFSYIFRTGEGCRSVLDVRFYNRRAFVGADNGIQQFLALGRGDLQESEIGRLSSASLRQQRVSELPARQIRGRLGAVAAACGPAGGVVGFGAATDDLSWRIVFKPFAERCYGVELNQHAVSCIIGSTAVERYSVSRQKVDRPSTGGIREDEHDDFELTDVKGREFKLRDAKLNQLITDLPGAIRTFLFRDTLWVLAEDGFYYFRLIQSDERVVSRSVKMAKPPARVLSATGSAAGMVIESDDEVFVLNHRQWRPLASEPVHSVRGYPSSKRYQNLITIALRDRVELAAIL